MRNSRFFLFSRAGTAWFLLLLIISLAGCATPIGVTKVDVVSAYQDINVNVLAGDELSSDTTIVLNRFNLVELFGKDPDAAIARLHEKAIRDERRDMFFALSELSFYYGKKLEAPKPKEKPDTSWSIPVEEKALPGYPPDYYLMSALYAFHYLLGPAKEDPPVAYDRRFRVACDLYNLALAKGFATGKDGALEFKEELRQLPTARVAISIKTDSLPLSLDDIKRFLPADFYRVNGLSVRARTPGLGLPLIATLKATVGLPGDPVVPVSALLRITGYARDRADKALSASLEFYSGYDETEVIVNTRKIPIETDSTTPLAYRLDDPSLWSTLGIKRFLTPEITQPLLLVPQPYRRGRIPVVFVHGTASNPLWWAEMWNTLNSDPVVRQRFQFWFFMYNSNNPIMFSGQSLRDHLSNELRKLDPHGRDPALQQMVVIGHSQGGLLTKMTAVRPGDKLWKSLSDQSPDKLGLTPEVRKMIDEVLFFSPVPQVKRVVFISTPHRGSYLAGNYVRKLVRWLVKVPKNIIQTPLVIFTSQTKDKLKLPKDMEGMIPTSVDSMSSGNPVLIALADLSVVPGVKAHSIIAVEGDGDYHKGNDGVVEYTSAHLDGVESEFIVRSGHSCQGDPLTIEEVRRILLEHLASLPRPWDMDRPLKDAALER